MKTAYRYGDWVYVTGGELPVRILLVDGPKFLALAFDSGVSQSRDFLCETVELVAHPDCKINLDRGFAGLSRLNEEERRLLREQARGFKPKLPFRADGPSLTASARREAKRRPRSSRSSRSY